MQGQHYLKALRYSEAFLVAIFGSLFGKKQQIFLLDPNVKEVAWAT